MDVIIRLDHFQEIWSGGVFVRRDAIGKHPNLPTYYEDSSIGAKSSQEKPGLHFGDRVVWMSDAGPEYGSVKWIGLLPDAKSDTDYTVGVEFVSIYMV